MNIENLGKAAELHYRIVALDRIERAIGKASSFSDIESVVAYGDLDGSLSEVGGKLLEEYRTICLNRFREIKKEILDNIPNL